MGQRRPVCGAGNLPSAVTSFVGRQREIREVRALLATARLVTLTGVGGVGKTRLATEVAAASGRSFPDGVWLVDLAAVDDPQRVARAVVTSLGMPDLSHRTAEQQIVERLADRQVLVVLDNCEHLLDACRLLCHYLLRACAGLRILTTSRELLGEAGEHVYPVSPLSVPAFDESVTPVAVAGFDAPMLLMERARAVRPDFEVTERNAGTVVRVCERLDGIPLAIELAASRLRSLPLQAILDRLEDRFALLTGGARAALPRQRTLRALIDWSYELCSPAEQLLWARLSVFVGGFTLHAAEDVCAGRDLPRAQVLDLIDHLVAQSVVVLVPAEDQTRYRLLETIREYGWQRVTERGEGSALRDRHRDYYLAFAERIAGQWNGPGQETGLALLRADRGNLGGALEWATSSPGSSREALILVTALRYHWCADGFLGSGRRWIDRALRIAADSDAGRISALWVAGWVMVLQGDLDAAEAALDECAALAAEAGDHRALGWASSLRATAAGFRGDLAASVTGFERVVESFSEDDELVRMTLFQLAVAYTHGRNPRACATARRAIELADRRGEKWTKSYAVWALGYDQLVRGDFDEAIASAHAALEIQREFNDHVGTALMIELLAWTAAARGEHRHAARLLGAIHMMWRRIGTSIAAFGPRMPELHAVCERIVTDSLPEATVRAERVRGEGLDHDQAIAYALDRSACGPQPATVQAGVLTARERQVAELLAQGLSNRQIAERLVVSPRTVDRHVENILCKLGFSSRAQVAAWTARPR
ncbi:LuxR family transcriptional regulator [Nocardia abscessus]|uniref:ATP-binding protein n=1 Tax=Nocardia abscessus TaxID=120957 RepID=UPI001892F172|nr:LuxR C-terminal-related transcriptional regulator [Nocardia abscessus]MBF6338812.1 LuxR family transcriptional regulator [Nocardia abscessus]